MIHKLKFYSTYKQFSDNDSFRKWLADTIFAMTYD